MRHFLRDVEMCFLRNRNFLLCTCPHGCGKNLPTKGKRLLICAELCLPWLNMIESSTNRLCLPRFNELSYFIARKWIVHMSYSGLIHSSAKYYRINFCKFSNENKFWRAQFNLSSIVGFQHSDSRNERQISKRVFITVYFIMHACLKVQFMYNCSLGRNYSTRIRGLQIADNPINFDQGSQLLVGRDWCILLHNEGERLPLFRGDFDRYFPHNHLEGPFFVKTSLRGSETDSRKPKISDPHYIEYPQIKYLNLFAYTCTLRTGC